MTKPTDVQNGKRIWLDIDGVRVRAGMVTANGVTTIAYPKGRGRVPLLGSEFVADDRLWTVHAVEELTDLGMVKLGIVEITA